MLGVYSNSRYNVLYPIWRGINDTMPIICLRDRLVPNKLQNNLSNTSMELKRKCFFAYKSWLMGA